ncbi:MAG: GTP cyclohydrolase I FolE2, partial [Phycisphaerales bacterium]|nr:GTP cyclohydrolase I FolE2 [Phycisphaerales bacterium]
MTTSIESDAKSIPDVQGRADSRRVAIDRVGVKDIRYPVTVATKDGGQEAVDATINMYVSLPADRKGTHMSRFLQILPKHQQSLGPGRLDELVTELRTALDAEVAQV